MENISINLAIMNALAALCRRHGKKYCFPSQASLLELMQKIYGIKRRRRCLNYHLKKLEEEGFIRRTRRIRSDGKGGLMFNSTLYVLTKRAIAFIGQTIGRLVRTGVRAWMPGSENKRKTVAEWIGVSEDTKIKMPGIGLLKTILT